MDTVLLDLRKICLILCVYACSAHMASLFANSSEMLPHALTLSFPMNAILLWKHENDDVTGRERKKRKKMRIEWLLLQHPLFQLTSTRS